MAWLENLFMDGKSIMNKMEKKTIKVKLRFRQFLGNKFVIWLIICSASAPPPPIGGDFQQNPLYFTWSINSNTSP